MEEGIRVIDVKTNITHLEAVQVVSVLVQDCCPVVHYTITRHHPRP